MATPSNNEQFVGIDASQDLREKSSGLTNSKRQIYTYADLMGGSIGATTLEAGTAGKFAGVSKLGVTYNVGGVEYDAYNLKCIAPLRPETDVHVVAIGSIEVGNGNIFFINNRNNVEAVDFGVTNGGYTNTPITQGAMVNDDTTQIARPLNGLFYVNQLNVPLFPVEFNAMYIIATDSAVFECDAYVDMDFICEKDTTVEFTIA